MRTLLAALVALFLFAAVSPALAQSDQDRATARNLSIEAQKALEAKDYERAADLFSRAEKLFHAPTLLVGLARSYVGLGKYVEAQESYNKVIHEKQPENASDAFKQAQADAKREVIGLDEKIGWVTISVDGAPEPRVTLDGEPMANASLGVKRAVNPGQHRVTAEADGFKPAESGFNATSGGASEVKLVLEADPNAKPAGGAQPASGQGAGQGGAPVVPPATTEDPGATQRLLGFVALGVGGAGLVVGGVTGGLAIGKHSDLESGCPEGACPAEQQDNLDSFHTLGTVSTIGFIAGGVLAAGGVVLVLTAPSADVEPAASASIGPGSVQATLRF